VNSILIKGDAEQSGRYFTRGKKVIKEKKFKKKKMPSDDKVNKNSKKPQSKAS